MRLIDGDAVLRFADAMEKENKDKYLTPYTLRYLIGKFPTLDVEPVKHGEWLEWELFSSDSRWYRYACSCCGEKYDNNTTYWKFCPNCGAKMDGGKTDGQ